LHRCKTLMGWWGLVQYYPAWFPWYCGLSGLLWRPLWKEKRLPI
jgi:hypothetical protein